MTLTEDTKLTAEAICTDILDILKEKFDVQEPKAQKFFGLEGLLNARELVYLVHILEDRYHIYFTAEDMDEERFYTVDGIADIVYLKLNPAVR